MANGTFDKAKGAVKEALGDLAGSKDLEAEGKTDQAKGSAKQAVETQWQRPCVKQEPRWLRRCVKPVSTSRRRAVTVGRITGDKPGLEGSCCWPPSRPSAERDAAKCVDQAFLP
jgi:uncharacterized protein YjbJ (UPF0337 family)